MSILSEPSPLQAKALSQLLKMTFQEGIPLYLSKGLTKKHIDALYETAYALYQTGSYEAACKVFRSMAFYSHLDKRAWLGLAGSTQMLRDYKNALQFYRIACLLDINNPVTYLHMHDCFSALKNRTSGLACVEKIILLTSQDKQYETLRARAELLRQTMQEEVT